MPAVCVWKTENTSVFKLIDTDDSIVLVFYCYFGFSFQFYSQKPKVIYAHFYILGDTNFCWGFAYRYNSVDLFWSNGREAKWEGFWERKELLLLLPLALITIVPEVGKLIWTNGKLMFCIFFNAFHFFSSA